jgi:tRNA-binding EMAP/Myf-like protein
MLVNVNKGTFAMVSGLVAKNNPTAVQVRTPTAVATISGNSFAVEVP